MPEVCIPRNMDGRRYNKCMQPNLKRRWYRGVLTSWPLLVLFLIVALWVSTRAFDMYKRYTLNVKEFEEVKGKQETLGARAVYLDETIDRLKTEEGIREEIQARLPYAKEGEQVIFIVNGSSTAKVSPVVTKKAHWWQFWK